MKVSYNWLNNYLKFSETPEFLSTILTSTGLEIESIVELFSSFDHLIVGKIIECVQHPNADRLKITKVDIGDSIKQIICGAPNVKNNQFVIIVLVGNQIVNINGEKIKIKKTKIRGEVSEGMICGADEIGLGYESDGIFELSSNCVPGRFVTDYLDIKKDFSMEIGLTPNRTDAFGHIGVCRDLYAYFRHKKKKVEFTIPDIYEYKSNQLGLSVDIRVDNPVACPQYFGVCIDNVLVQESPIWLQNKLIAVGLKPVNNIVDITNFVLYETGNPLHAFDYNKIDDGKIIVRNAQKGEFLQTLDSKNIELNESDLVICDNKKPLCLAGVMGSLNSGVVHGTNKIFLESAFFDPKSIRKTSKRHSLSSDSSYRFERGVDFNNCLYALKRASLLIQQICGGSIAKEVTFSSNKLVKNEINFSFNFFTKISGYKISPDSIIDILRNLGFEILDRDKEKCRLIVPSFRFDVYRPIDVVEEILRIHGYDNIPESPYVKYQPSIVPEFSMHQIKIDVSNILVSNSFFEMQNNSLIPDTSVKLFHSDSVVKILNPLSNDLSVLRHTMYYSGLKTIKFNLNRQSNNLKFFEFGKIYKKIKTEHIEKEKIAIFVTGGFSGGNWFKDANSANFFFMKGVFAKVLSNFGLNSSFFQIKESSSNYAELQLSYQINGSYFGEVGLFSQSILNAFGIKKKVYFAEINLSALYSHLGQFSCSYTSIPKFPFVKRDLSLLIDKNISYMEIKNNINNIGSKLLKSISLFDVYQGDQIEKNKKSYAISFLFQSNDRTLTDLEVDKELIRIYNSLVSKFKLSLREGELKL